MISAAVHCSPTQRIFGICTNVAAWHLLTHPPAEACNIVMEHSAMAISNTQLLLEMYADSRN